MLGIPNPYVLLAAAGLLIASHGYAYFNGRGDGAASVGAKYAKASGKALAAMRRGEAAINHLNGNFAIAKQRQDTETGRIRNAATPLIARAPYALACVDADGVGLLDLARTNGNIALDPGEPDGRTGRAAGDAAEP